MKKLIFCMLVGLIVTSCGKTTKSKMANNWNVTSYKEQVVNIDTNSYQLTGTTSIEANDYSYLLTDKSSVVHFTKQGEIIRNKYVIKKDGTWSWECEFTYRSNSVSNPPLEKQVTQSSGTWSFVGKNKTDNFHKHERIIFNILSESENIQNLDDPTNSKNTVSTYKTGEKSCIYTVKSSKNKKLILALDHQNSQVMNGDTYVENRNVLMTLEADSRK